ncbi:MAG TPA: hypothetical protein VKY60_08670 [Burkholderiaceae bacterium]|nr:hypothetical protein [Burkholderiaceae bacterium]
MNWRLIFANAIARRVAYVLVAVVLAWVGLGDARAQSFPDCLNPDVSYAVCPDRASADAGARAYTEKRLSTAPGARACLIKDTWDGTTGRVEYAHSSYTGTESVCPPLGVPQKKGARSFAVECVDGTWNPDTRTCDGCASKPYLGAGAWSNVQGGKMCKDSCEYEGGTSPGGGVGVCFDMVVDGQSYTYCSGWGPTGSQCTVDGPGGFPGIPSEAPPDSDGDGTSDDFDSAPNNPGRGGSGPDGEPTQEDGDCGGIGQPECGALGSGSGNGNTSGGGGDCNTPPSSTGDPILAQIAFQTWATRCAVEGNANAGPGSGSGDGGEGLLDQLRAEAAGLDQSLGEGDADAAWIEGPTTLDLDTGGLGIGGTCPAPPTVNGFSIDPDGNLCMLVQIIGALVLVGAYVHAGYIIGRA